MNINLGYLGKVVLVPYEEPWMTQDGFLITHDGYTESGIRVHGVLDEREHYWYPTCWNDAILIKVNQ